MTNLILIQLARCRFGYAERPEIWFWKVAERSGIRLRLNDNQPQKTQQQLSLFD